MLRKILIALVLLVLVAGGGLVALIATNSDIIIDKFNAYVETSTGAPLVSDTPPTLTLFPNRGLELGASSWQSPDGSLSFSFSRASVMISSHALFTGKFSIKHFSVDDLDLTMKLKKPVREYLAGIPAGVEHRRDFDELIQSILHALHIAPDNIRINQGRICFIQPDGSTLTIAPLSLNATNVHPGTPTNFNLQTDIDGSSPDFHAGVELHCSALLDKEKASFSIEKAMLTPGMGVSFREYLSLSGKLEYDFDSDELTLSQLHFQGPDLSATASGSVASLARMYSDPVQGDATLNVDMEGDPQRLGEILHHPLPFADHSIFSDCSFAAEMRWAEGRMRMTNIRGKADDLTFSGALTLSPSPFVISGELNLGDFNLDDYRSEKREGASRKLEERDFTRWPRVNLQLSAEHVRWNRLHLEDVHARLTGQNGSYEFNPLSGILAGSPVTASMKTVLLPTTPLSSRLSLNFSVPQANLEEISQALAERPLLKGSGAINASLAFTTSRGLPSLTGRGSLTSSQVETVFSILPPDIPLASSFLSSSRFERLFLSFVSKDGTLTVDRLTLEAARLSLSGSGTVNLEQRTVDAEGSVQIAGTSAMPVRLEGDLREPKYSLEGKKQNHTLSPRAIELDLSFSDQVRDLLK
ncbi:AsmA-like C-terminal region-containing protein [Mailhella massiliensis]|uniref:AsmA-like C-terminal region-containing protein n=1 Tax=Mailhella massiliensis TaxID=1903261 RepID=A0A921DQN2_9BACT|nr:AsmA-like C-terminal region-containing protein [Mailhella massiliensis]HJD96126.1 AsmA-like C-terminal region-containing protein [Mailhella massiliensis]